MAKIKLKICGMKDCQNILEIAALQPDFIGFIFWKPSPRCFDGVLPELPKSIRKVGVFVDASLQEIASKIVDYQLDMIQLHGNETAGFCRTAKAFDLKIIKAFSISETFDFERLKPYESAVDYFLFDTKCALPGGNGIAFNWEILNNYKASKPIFLSGGIGPESVEAIKILKLPIYAMDVNSRFETSPGHKDVGLLTRFKNQLP